MTTTNSLPEPELADPSDSPAVAARRRPTSVVLADDQLVVYRGRDFNGGLPCVADRGDGEPCRRDVLDGVYSGFWECHIRGMDGYVSVYDTEGLVPAGQLLQQRCEAHAATETADAEPPSGEAFNPEVHKDVVRRYSPYWTPDGVVKERRSPTWPTLTEGSAPSSTPPAPAPPVVEVAPPEPTPTALYRYWDEADVLLYVGITGDLKHRERSHLKRSSWMEFVARSTVERFPSREDAGAAEVEAIVTEQPLFNAKHNESPEAVQRVVEYLVERGRVDLLAPAVSRG